jgi:hypothetical protein
MSGAHVRKYARPAMLCRQTQTKQRVSAHSTHEEKHA